MPKRKKKKRYQAEFCLTCVLSNQTSLGHMARTLGSIGRTLCHMHEAGIVLSDRELLREGIVSLVTDDPEAAKLLEVFREGTHGHRPDDPHDTC